jgi:hypothetical protein
MYLFVDRINDSLAVPDSIPDIQKNGDAIDTAADTGHRHGRAKTRLVHDKYAEFPSYDDYENVVIACLF